MSAASRHYRLLLGSSQLSQSTPQRPANDPFHRHTFFEPCVVLSGTGQLIHGGKQFALKPGDLFVSDVGIVHAIRSLETRDLKLYYTSFAIAEIESAGAGGDLFENQIIWNFLKNHKTVCRGQDHLFASFEFLLRMSKRQDWSNRTFFLQGWMRLLVLQIMATLTTAKMSEVANDTGGDELARAIR